jgi:adenylate kinase family enzyme
MDLPLVHLDQEYWHPGWVESTPKEWHKKMQGLVAEERWLMDGNYSGTWGLRLPRTELVIYLQYPLRTLLYRALKRVIAHHGQTRPDMAPGCPERFDLEFLRFVVNCPLRQRPKHLKLLSTLREDQQLLVFHKPRALEDWVRALEIDRTGN